MPLLESTHWSDVREWSSIVLQSNPFPLIWLACRWLSPLAIIVAISALIAYTTTTAFTATQTVEPGARTVFAGPSQLSDSDVGFRSVLTEFIEPKSAVMQVRCPDDPSYVADIRVDNVQALDTIREGNCEMRPLADLGD